MNGPNSARNGITSMAAAAVARVWRKGVASVFARVLAARDVGGSAAVVAFPRPLPSTIPGNISSSVCKISEFHVALFRYVTHAPPPPPPPFIVVLIAPVSQRYSLLDY